MTTRMLCEMIDMPEVVTRTIETWNAIQYEKELDHYLELVRDKAKWDEALDGVRKILGEDQEGLKCLAFMLHVAMRSYQEYLRRGISDKIFIATMGCFSRFVKEHQDSYGSYGFDREWWTVRELTLREFRLGELEYEMIEDKDEKKISIHIPSDANLEEDKCLESYHMAKSFFSQYEVDYAEVEYYCNSWLLYPMLFEFLPENSKIIRFQKDFIIDFFEPDNEGYKLWVFKNKTLTIDELPENTSLQRRMKEHLKKGGKIGSGRGHIKKELFK